MTEFNHHGIASLDHWGLIRAHGDDAVKFLHGQLTQDLVLLPPGGARLAAYCSPKGRMLASFIAIKRAQDEVWLACPRDLVPAMVKRLQMFVMRAKVHISDETGKFALYGVLGGACEPSPNPPPAQPLAWEAWAREGGGHVVAMYPAMGVSRQLWIAPMDTHPLPPSTLERAVWDCSEVLSAVGHVQAASSDLFVPQMLNYESVGGVNFKKGCYPGQEVVARSQFRGTLKRRTYLARTTAPLQVAQELVLRDDPSQTAAIVVAAAPVPGAQKEWMALICLQTQFAQTPLATAAHPEIHIACLPLPYALLEDI